MRLVEKNTHVFQDKSQAIAWLEEVLVRSGFPSGFGAAAERHLERVGQVVFKAEESEQGTRFLRELKFAAHDKNALARLFECASNRAKSGDTAALLREDAIDRVDVLLRRRDWAGPEFARQYREIDLESRRELAREVLDVCRKQGLVRCEERGIYCLELLTPRGLSRVAAPLLSELTEVRSAPKM